MLQAVPICLPLPPEADMTPSLSCPRCNSPHITTRDYASKAGSAIGTVAGAAGGAAAMMAGAETGATLGLVAGPIGSIVGGLAGGLMGMLLGGATGCATGHAVGSQLDDLVFDNHECQDCGHVFRVSVAKQ